MPRVTTVKSARKDYPDHGIKKGETYYWWKFKNGPKYVSKTYPKPQQLTSSSYLIAVYDITDEMTETSEINTAEDLQGWVDSLKEKAEELLGTTEESLERMPENLQENSPAAELLRERIETLENFISELDGLDTDFDEDGDEELSDWLSSKIEEVQNFDIS